MVNRRILYHISYISYHMNYIPYHTSYILYHMDHTSYNISYISYHMSYVSYNISRKKPSAKGLAPIYCIILQGASVYLCAKDVKDQQRRMCAKDVKDQQRRMCAKPHPTRLYNTYNVNKAIHVRYV